MSLNIRGEGKPIKNLSIFVGIGADQRGRLYRKLYITGGAATTAAKGLTLATLEDLRDALKQRSTIESEVAKHDVKVTLDDFIRDVAAVPVPNESPKVTDVVLIKKEK